MTTLAFTVGTGWFNKVAPLVAKRFQRLNGIGCRALTEKDLPLRKALPGTHWVPAFLWDIAPKNVDRVIWMDADIIPLQRIGALPDQATFAACPEYGLHETEKAKKERCYVLQRFDTHFNSGFFVARRDAEPAFRLMHKLMWAPKPCGTRTQDWWNLAVHSLLGGFSELPREWNWCRSWGPPTKDVKQVHIKCGMKQNRSIVVQGVWKALQNGVEPDWSTLAT